MKEYIEKLQEAARQLNTTIDNMWNHNEGISSMIPDRYIKAINVAQQNLYAALNAPSPVIDLSGVTKEGLVERMSAHALAIEAYKAGQQAGVSKPVWVKASERLPKADAPRSLMNVRLREWDIEREIDKNSISKYFTDGIEVCVNGKYRTILHTNIEWLDETAQQAPERYKVVCRDCGGSGIVVNYTTSCCNRPNEDGSCCNYPIPEPIQEQCARCQTTGYEQAPDHIADVGKMVDHSVGVNEMIPERFYAVEYSGYWSIQTTPFYDVEDVLNADHIGSIEAEKNAKLIADLLNKHYAGQQAQGYNEQHKGWVALFKDEESYVQFLKWRQQAPEPVEYWTKKKPELPKEECLLLAASYYDGWNYSAYEIAKVTGEEGWYMAILQDGDEWGDYEDLSADLYRIIPTPKPI